MLVLGFKALVVEASPPFCLKLRIVFNCLSYENCRQICQLRLAKNAKVALRATFNTLFVGAHGFEPLTLCL